jgi:hypothetical protein
MLCTRRRSALTSVLFLSLLIQVCEPLLEAQSSVSNGVIDGQVVDGSGAVIPEAVVTLTNTSNGFKQSGLSNNDGLYSFSAVPTGVYTISVSAPGFKMVQISNVNSSVGQTNSVTVKMEIGDVTQNVQVSAAAEVLNTSDSSVNSVLGQNVIQNLPSLRRNYTDFALLVPGATQDGQFGSVSFAGSLGDVNSSYSNTNASNSYSVDGANATSRYLGEQRGQTRIPYLFGGESVQEFQVSENPYSPAYGGGATGYVNTVTKSGTNSFHGDAFYFNRNTALGAEDAVSKAAGYPKALDVRQQFGAGLGGPIVKDKVFFFFDYEQQRRKDPISVINPAQAAVSETSFGVPAGTLLPSPTGYPVPSGLTTAAPTNPTYLQQVSNALYEIDSNLGFRHRRQDDLVLFGRVDLLATENDRVSLHYNYNHFNSPGGSNTFNPISTSGVQGLASNFVRDHDALVHWTHVVNSSLLLDTHVGYTRDDQISLPADLTPDGFLPTVKLTAPSAFTIGNGAPTDLREYEWSFSEHVSWTTGRHTFDFGTDIDHDSNVSLAFTGYNGSYTFPSLVDFALGEYSLYSQSSGQPLIRVGFPTYAFYIGDTYKVNSKLTLNLGFREDFTVYPQPPLNPAVPLTGQYPNDYDRWAPRIGFAYHVLPRTVIRGGFGMFRSFVTSENYINATTSNGLASLRSSLSLKYNNALAPDAQTILFPNILPTSSTLFAASANVNVVNPGLKDPSTSQGSLQVEQQLNSSLTMTVGSMWVHSEHLISSSYYDLNLKQPTGTTQYVVCPAGTITVPCAGTNSVSLMNLDAGTLQEGALYPGVGQVDALISPGNSTYIAGFTQFRQTYHHGFSGIVSYTLSKNIASNGVDFNNQFSFANTKELDVLDQRHRVVAGLVYQSQYSGSGLKKALLSNWMISTNTQYGSGHPYTGLLLNGCVGTTATTCTGGSNLNDSAYNYSGGIAHAGPSPNLGYNSFTGPWTGSLDINLERAFAIKEYGKLMFRVTGFNMLNDPNYYVQSGSGVNQSEYKPVGPNCGNKAQNQVCYLVPNNTVGGFGTFQIVQQNTGPRIFQFAMIYRF